MRINVDACYEAPGAPGGENREQCSRCSQTSPVHAPVHARCSPSPRPQPPSPRALSKKKRRGSLDLGKMFGGVRFVQAAEVFAEIDAPTRPACSVDSRWALKRVCGTAPHSSAKAHAYRRAACDAAWQCALQCSMTLQIIRAPVANMQNHSETRASAFYKMCARERAARKSSLRCTQHIT
jgi:hypothetical protein